MCGDGSAHGAWCWIYPCAPLEFLGQVSKGALQVPHAVTKLWTAAVSDLLKAMYFRIRACEAQLG